MNQTRPPFDAVTMWLHWLMLALIAAMFATAWLHAAAADGETARALLQAHRSFGVVVWIAAVARLAWRLTCAYLPPFPAHMNRAHRAAATCSEYALYALLLLQPLTGMAQTILRGRAFDLFLIHIGPLAPRDRMLAAVLHDVHAAGAWTMLALIALHASAALVHHFVFRDGVLASMAPLLKTRSSAVTSRAPAPDDARMPTP